MPVPNACTPCDCIPNNINDAYFKQAVITLLCDISAGEGGGGVANITGINGVTPLVGNGVTGTGSLRVTIASNNTPFDVNAVLATGIAGLLINEDSAATNLETIAKIGAVTQATLSASDGDGDWGWIKKDSLGRLWTSATYLEDVAAVSGDQGHPALFRRTDTAAAQTDTTGDYTLAVTNSFGALQINIDSTFQATASTGLLKLEDVASASGDAGVAMLMKRTDTAAAQTDTTGDYTLPVANSFGAQQINIDSTFQATLATGLLKLAGGTFATGDAGVQSLVRYTSSGQLGGPGNGLYGPLVGLNGTGALLTALTRTGFSTDPVRAEDEALANAEAGIVVFTQRETNPTILTSGSLDAAYFKSNDLGYLYVDTILRATGTATSPTINTATSTTIVSSNAARRFVEIQNNSAANIMISLTGFTLIGIVPSSTNIGFVITPGGTFFSPPNYCPTGSITCYQTSGGTINTVSVYEG